MRIKLLVMCILLSLQGCASISKRQMIEECKTGPMDQCDKHMKTLHEDGEFSTMDIIADNMCTFKRNAKNCIINSTMAMEAGNQYLALVQLRFACEELQDKTACNLIKDINHGMDAQAKRGYPVINPVQFTMPDNSGIWNGVAGMVSNIAQPRIQEMPRMPTPVMINSAK